MFVGPTMKYPRKYINIRAFHWLFGGRVVRDNSTRSLTSLGASIPTTTSGRFSKLEILRAIHHSVNWNITIRELMSSLEEQ